jgi:DNA-binding transcriptional ArsR family regulator
MASKEPDNHTLLAALKHPLRRRVLRTMANKKPISPRELANRLEEPLSTVSYHVRILAESGVIEEVSRCQVRGATQHFYRWALKSRWAIKVLKEAEQDPPKDKG